MKLTSSNSSFSFQSKNETNILFNLYLIRIAFACFTFHYLKREFETIFIHRFGKATMPIFNLFKNSSYYWGNAALMAYFVNHPLYTATSETVVYVGLALFIVNLF